MHFPTSQTERLALAIDSASTAWPQLAGMVVLESNHSKIVEVQLLCTTDSALNLCPIYLSQTSCACAEHYMHRHKKFELNRGAVSRKQKLYLNNLKELFDFSLTRILHTYVTMVFCCITPYLREARKLFLHENASFLMLLRGNRDFSSKVAPRSLQIETEGRDL